MAVLPEVAPAGADEQMEGDRPVLGVLGPQKHDCALSRGATDDHVSRSGARNPRQVLHDDSFRSGAGILAPGGAPRNRGSRQSAVRLTTPAEFRKERGHAHVFGMAAGRLPRIVYVK